MPALLLTNIGQLLTLRGPAPRRGHELADLSIVEDAAVLCADGKIVAVGRRGEITKQAEKDAQEVDCERGVVLPGFVDSHTHPVFAAPRLVDFEKRIAGATYEEIAAAGGGIRASVDAVRSASREELASAVLGALNEMASYGSTTVEAKSAYGSSLGAEMKSLEAMAAV